MLSTTYAEEADALNMQTQKKPFQPTFPIFPFRSLIDKNAFFSAIFFFFFKKKGQSDIAGLQQPKACVARWCALQNSPRGIMQSQNTSQETKKEQNHIIEFIQYLGTSCQIGTKRVHIHVRIVRTSQARAGVPM